jgi:membrane protein implicated in regulation of membrane protease activity
MNELFAWYNLVFYVPVLFGVILVLGSAFGLADHDADAGHDADGGHDAEHDADGKPTGAVDAHASPDHEPNVFTKALSVLGVGRVPITIVLMTASLIFGGLGIVANTLLASLIGVSGAFALISVAVAFVGMVFLTGWTARGVARIMPSTETYRVSKTDLVGKTGQLVLPADTSYGLAQVRDHEGNVHNLTCRTAEGTIPKGSDVLVYDYDEEKKVYVVAPYNASKEIGTV